MMRAPLHLCGLWRLRRILVLHPHRMRGQAEIDRLAWPTEELDLYDRARTVLAECAASMPGGRVAELEKIQQAGATIHVETPFARIRTTFDHVEIRIMIDPRRGTPVDVTVPYEFLSFPDMRPWMAMAASRLTLSHARRMLDHAQIPGPDDHPDLRRILCVHLARLVADGRCGPNVTATATARLGRPADKFHTHATSYALWAHEDGTPLHRAPDFMWTLSIRKGPSYSGGTPGPTRITATMRSPQESVNVDHTLTSPADLIRQVRDPGVPGLVQIVTTGS